MPIKNQYNKELTNIDRLEYAINKLLNKKRYINFLEFCKKFYKEDFKNQLLIFDQCEEACIVKSFIEWKYIGRKLKIHPRTICLYKPYKKKVKKSIKGQININGKETKERKNNRIEIIGDKSFERINKYDISDTIIDKKSPYKNCQVQIEDYFVDKETLLMCLNNLYHKYNDTELNIDKKIFTRLKGLIEYLIEGEKIPSNKELELLYIDSLTLLVAYYFNIDVDTLELRDFDKLQELNIIEFLNFGDELQRKSVAIISFLKESIDTDFQNKLCV